MTLRRCLLVVLSSAAVFQCSFLGCGGDSFSSAPAGSDAGTGGSSGAGAGGSGGKGGTAGGGVDAGPDGSAGAAGKIDAGEDVTESDAPVLCDPTEKPSGGVFVSAGAPGGGDGSPGLPFGTVSQALAAVGPSGTLHLAPGTYAEHVAIDATHAGLTVRGGWVVVGASWTRDCSADARAKTVLPATTPAVVRVNAVGGQVSFRTLSVLAAAAPAAPKDTAGISAYGFRVTGGGTRQLYDVHVKAGAGSAGGAGTDGAPSVAPDCSDLISNCSDGLAGMSGANASPAAEGFFSDQAYMPRDGQVGQPGGAGHHGKPGTAGQLKLNCYASASGSGGAGPCANHFCGNIGAIGAVGTESGRCGCGGAGGPGGAAGKGGGASIGVFLSGANTSLVLVRSSIESSAGGAGSIGGDGGEGMPGGDGAAAVSKLCYGPCESVNKGNDQCNCEQPGTSTVPGGAAGTQGGPGGKGGAGSGGAGGPSHAVVLIDGAQMSQDPDSVLAVQAGGPGGGSSPAGASSNVFED